MKDNSGDRGDGRIGQLEVTEYLLTDHVLDASSREACTRLGETS